MELLEGFDRFSEYSECCKGLFYFQDGLTPPGGLWGEQSLVEAQAPWREPVAEEEAVSAQKTATVTLLKSSQSAALLVSHENDELLR